VSVLENLLIQFRKTSSKIIDISIEREMFEFKHGIKRTGDNNMNEFTFSEKGLEAILWVSQLFLKT